jgi:ferritin
MLSKNLQNALNEQINKEFFSEFAYLSMAAYAKSLDLDGISNYFNLQAQEEHLHAIKLYNYVLDRGGKIELKPIGAPKTEFTNIVQVFENTLEHEQFVTQSINDIMNIAMNENDHATASMLKWFIDEQVEEEANANRNLNRIKMINGEGQGLLLIDAELATRKPSTAAE